MSQNFIILRMTLYITVVNTETQTLSQCPNFFIYNLHFDSYEKKNFLWSIGFT